MVMFDTEATTREPGGDSGVVTQTRSLQDGGDLWILGSGWFFLGQ
jgi:hypothetical protein